MDNIKQYLDEMVGRFNNVEFVKNDPIQFPRSYTNRQDVEIAAFLASTIAWGNRKQINKGCERMLVEVMGNKPFDFIMGEDYLNVINPDMNIHRTFFGRDLIYMCNGLHLYYSRQSSLEVLFYNNTPWDGFKSIREVFTMANRGKTTKHISNPQGNDHKAGSACKRLNMMLRWLCRKDGIVDIGIWKDINPSILMIPIDVHVARIGRELGLIERKQNDRITVEELTRKLRDMDANDPCKYDFALFGIGESQKHIQS